MQARQSATFLPNRGSHGLLTWGKGGVENTTAHSLAAQTRQHAAVMSADSNRGVSSAAARVQAEESRTCRQQRAGPDGP